jgi:hypothetical protein
MDKKDIYKLRQELAKEEERVDKAKTKRAIIAILIIGAVFFLLAVKSNEIKNIKDFIITLIACVFGAGIYFYVSILVFTPLVSMAQSDNARIKYLKKQIDEFERRKARNEKRKARIAMIEKLYPNENSWKEIVELLDEEEEVGKALAE